ncbi:hypothetical protein [Clostridium estertheticum]|uniref:hypothetical protein n=1 Tax=Clostridium estertheticum TaxID=238834 RepID=UPI001C7DF90D|nr:hypothetical protein [Clostridium estertheticum]MBX4266331.1 hypothetical protein [Clostridium estertheticum]WLC86925.1 hypothetical protein KTC95_12085 [Clostridium estertheticum]
MYSGSKYDVAIIVICLIIIAFVSTMMRSEIEKSKTKIRDGIITVFIMIGFLGFSMLSLKFEKFEYFLFSLFLMLFVFVIIKDIKSFLLKRNYSRLKSISIKVKYTGTYNLIFLIIFTLQSITMHQSASKLELISEIFIIIILVIDLPLDYLANKYLNFYESGIFINTGAFSNKIIEHAQLVSYKKVESLTFLEYEKGKYILNIQADKSIKKLDCKYRIKDYEKKEIISFVCNFIEEKKIIILKEY